MLNILWPFFIIISIFYAILSGNIENINNCIFESAENAVKLTLTLLGATCLWSGIMEIASKTDIIKLNRTKPAPRQAYSRTRRTMFF